MATALSLKNTCEEYINHALLHLKFERIRKTNSRPDYRSYKNSGGASSWRSEIKSSGLLQQQHHHHHKSSAMNHENRGRGEFRDGRLSSFKAEKDQFLEETASDEQMVTSSATIRKIRY